MTQTALVLSGGGMFGAYQAGVWLELSKYFQPDLIVGASVGSLNGWAIAGDIAPDDLVASWLDEGNMQKARLRLPRSAYDGFIDCKPLETWIQRWHGRWTPRRRIGVALTRFWDFQPVLVEGDAITWQHLAASCGVPLFLRQYRLNGHRYADGGLLTPLPLWGAVRMGAKRIVCVNLLGCGGGSFLSHSGKFLRWKAGFRVERPEGVEIVDIDPPEALGPPAHMIHWDLRRAERWIELGREQALAKIGDIEALVKTFSI